MSDKIEVTPSPSNDSRETNHPITKEELLLSTKMHQQDVKNGLRYFAGMLLAAADLHDHTKIDYIDEFLKQFQAAQKTGQWPEGPGWWYNDFHLTEWHHLEDRVPNDVNLVDIFEMLVDCVMAGMARKGSYSPENEPDGELLKKAFQNTRDLLISKIKLMTPEEQQKAAATQEALHQPLHFKL